MRRIILLVTVALVMAAMFVFAAPTFAVSSNPNAHQCLSGEAKGPPCGPDEDAAEGIACASIASERKHPHLVVSLCTHPVNNNNP